MPSSFNISRLSVGRLTTKEVRRGEEKGCPGGNQEATRCQFYPGDTIPHLVGEYGDDQEGQWEIAMCTNYTNLNKVFPKDPYPLPSIDWLMGGASGSTLLNITRSKCTPEDNTKTAFITDAGAYYYKVMPFGLKNVGATYQHLMDRIFKDLIGGDMEVYVDDMVVKFMATTDHCKALGRVFQVLRKHQLKMNLENALSQSRLENF
ncbi:Retrovirus-related Pol polyprotein from transposon 17.6, partial [Mucuna pruriens]